MLQDEEEKGLRLETMIYDKMRKVILRKLEYGVEQII